MPDATSTAEWISNSIERHMRDLLAEATEWFRSRGIDPRNLR